MSNHWGSYMLNDVLQIVKKMGIYDTIGEEKFREFVFSLLKLGTTYDCNNGEILEGFCEELGLCSCCLAETKDIDDGLCKDCR
jgi:hypothetical protein